MKSNAVYVRMTAESQASTMRQPMHPGLRGVYRDRAAYTLRRLAGSCKCHFLNTAASNGLFESQVWVSR